MVVQLHGYGQTQEIINDLTAYYISPSRVTSIPFVHMMAYSGSVVWTYGNGRLKTLSPGHYPLDALDLLQMILSNTICVC